MIIEGSRLPAGSGSENAEDEITSRTRKERIHLALETAQANTRASRVTHYFLMLLILGNVIAVILESMRPLKRQFATVFWGFEFLSVGVFTFEYILRLWTCTADERYRSRFWGRVKFARTPLALIDLIAIAPFYLPFVVADLRVLRAMRLFRILRVLKFGRYSDAFRLLAKVIRSKRQDLIATTTVLAILLIVAASMMYEAESAAQPDKFSSIPEAMWWAVVTMTTVGYGDVYPVTALGKLFGGLIAVLGIGMFALPTGIIGAGFVEQLQARKVLPQNCPHCGQQLE